MKAKEEGCGSRVDKKPGGPNKTEQKSRTDETGNY